MGRHRGENCRLSKPEPGHEARSGGTAHVALLALAIGWGCSAWFGGPRALPPDIFGDASGDAVTRATALVARMTLAEKVSQLQNEAPAIPRLRLVAYDWWSEGLHGVARNGIATVFPQSIGLAATFDEDLVRRVGAAVADEARAKFEAAHGRERGSGQYEGLTVFAPNVNIVRDPRWGRAQETYGEDPFLSARMGVAYVRGLQGDGDGKLRVAAVVKHFAVHSGPELDRHRFDAVVSAHDLADTYLPQFEAIVREAHPAGVMAAYNRVNGVPVVANRELLETTLRGKWGFGGFVVGDCGAVGDVAHGHHFAPDETHAAALALRAGTDLDCGSAFRKLVDAVAAGLVTEAEIDRAVIRLMAVRFRLGLFDAAGGNSVGVPLPADFPPASHRALAREAAVKSMVLLENDGTLPIAAGVKRIAVVGPLADDEKAPLGNYHGTARDVITPLRGIRTAAAARGVAVEFARGVTLAGRTQAGLREAVLAARRADLVVAVLGLSPQIEGEEGDNESSNPAGDRRDLNLPGRQATLLQVLLATGKPVVVALTGGGALVLPEKPRQPNALLMTWYAGEQGGHALADLLFGDASPSGRLPVTFYRGVSELPPFDSYAMAGRTYRYFGGKPAYAFGAGRSYGSVSYSDVTAEVVDGGKGGVVVRATVKNEGARAVEEVVQVWVAQRTRVAGDPLRSLAGFRRETLAPGQARKVAFNVPTPAFTMVSAAGQFRSGLRPWEVVLGTAPSMAVPLSEVNSAPESRPF